MQTYQYQPIKYFGMVFLFTWAFWIAAAISGRVNPESGVIAVAAIIVVLANRELFFETRHIGRMLES